MSERVGPREVLDAMRSLLSYPMPSISVNLDSQIEDSPIFFKVLVNHWPGKVILLTHCDKELEAQSMIELHSLRCDELVVYRNSEDKAALIIKAGVMAHFDAEDSSLNQLPDTSTVFIR